MEVYRVYDENDGSETRGRFIKDPIGVIQGYEVLTPPFRRKFHEDTNGSGVFMQLSQNPAIAEAEQMVRLLESINVLMTR